MPIKSTQFKFTAGELDPLLIGRTDLERYYAAVESAVNVKTLNQGGLQRADGLQFVDKLPNQINFEDSPTITTPNGGVGANANDMDRSTTLVTTVPIGVSNYIVVDYLMTSGNDQAAFVDIKGIFLTSTTNSEWFVQARFGAGAWQIVSPALTLIPFPRDFRIRVEGQYDNYRLQRIGSTDLGLDVITLDEFHVYTDKQILSDSVQKSFQFNVDQTYLLLFTDKNIAIYRDEIFQANVAADKITNEMLAKLKKAQSADTMIITHEDLLTQKLTREGTDVDWLLEDVPFDFIPRFAFDPVITNPNQDLTPSGTDGVIQISTVPNLFVPSDVGQIIQGNGGRGRIVQFVTAKIVDVFMEIPFISTIDLDALTWDFIKGHEDVWSASRGWPATVTFHEGRLWFGGSKSRTTTVWGSEIDAFFNFDVGILADNSAIDVTLDTKQLNKVVNMQSINSNLIIFTTGGEFSIPQRQEQPITPENIAFRQQGQYGSEEGFDVGAIDNNSIFIQNGGKSIIKYNFDTLEAAFKGENITLFSSHLIFEPMDFAVRKASSTEEGDLILFINNSGCLVLGTILFSQNVVGFTQRNTSGGLFKSVGVDGNTVYVVVERVIDGNTVRYLELFNPDALLDSSTIVTAGLPTDTFTGLDHLEGETVKVIGDGSVLQDQVVTGGSITTERDIQTDVEIGINMTPIIKTLPLEILELGSRVGVKKRISEAILRINETGDFTVNGNDVFPDMVSFRTFGPAGMGSPLDAPPPLFTGDKKVKGLLGWAERKQLTISQSEPAKMTILSITVNANL